MDIIPFQHLACPLDGEPLSCDATAWRCANGHSFDIAAKGYTHLLPVQNKRSRDPGDHKSMVAARQRFLNAGFYRPVAAAVSETLLLQVASSETLSCLDAGCGEGYYLRELAAMNRHRTLSLIGVDISKWAVLAAAKQDSRPNWVVGSNANLPVLPGTLDCVLCMFGFPVYPEFARVIKPGGVLVQVDAGADHLRELREIIYPSQKPSRERDSKAPDGFTRLDSQVVRYSLDLQGAEVIADLLAMTPHFYRASAQGRAQAAALNRLELTVEVTVATYRRDPK